MATTFLSPAVQTNKKKAAGIVFLCLFLAECVRHSPTPAPLHLIPVCLDTMRLLPPQPTQRFGYSSAAVCAVCRLGPKQELFFWRLCGRYGGEGSRRHELPKTSGTETLCDASGPTLKSAVCGVANPLGWRRKMENNNR